MVEQLKQVDCSLGWFFILSPCLQESIDILLAGKHNVTYRLIGALNGRERKNCT